jgi:hypothetical protein
MRQERADRGGYDDGERGADAKLHPHRLWHIEHAENLIQHRDDDRAATDAEKTCENPGDNTARNDPNRKHGQIAERNPEHSHSPRAGLIQPRR